MTGTSAETGLTRRPFGRLVAVMALAIALAGCAGAPGAFPMEERFEPCPSSPNCVSSYATGDQHAIDPLPIPTGSDPIDSLTSIVESIRRTRIMSSDESYLHATFTSRVFRFVDDVEFRVDREAGVVHVRSASRVGYGDLGANRRRVEEIRAQIEQNAR